MALFKAIVRIDRPLAPRQALIGMAATYDA
jgi:hypothetical protein